jgi:hypothetical protein
MRLLPPSGFFSGRAKNPYLRMCPTIFTPTGGEKESVEAETDARMIFAPLLVLLLEPTEGDATAHNAFPCRECQPAGGANVGVGCCS